MVSSKFSYVVIDVKLPFSKVSFSKTTEHTLTFQNYKLQNKLLQELGEEIFIILLNTVQSKISHFIILMWEYQNQLEFITITVQIFSTVYH